MLEAGEVEMGAVKTGVVETGVAEDVEDAGATLGDRQPHHGDLLPLLHRKLSIELQLLLLLVRMIGPATTVARKVIFQPTVLKETTRNQTAMTGMRRIST